jgi:hypothetical protein
MGQSPSARLALVNVDRCRGSVRLHQGCRGLQVRRCQRHQANGSPRRDQPLTGERPLLVSGPQQLPGRRSDVDRYADQAFSSGVVRLPCVPRRAWAGVASGSSATFWLSVGAGSGRTISKRTAFPATPRRPMRTSPSNTSSSPTSRVGPAWPSLRDVNTAGWPLRAPAAEREQAPGDGRKGSG